MTFISKTETTRAIIPPVEVPTTRSNFEESGLPISFSSSCRKTEVASPLTPPPSRDKTYFVMKVV